MLFFLAGCNFPSKKPTETIPAVYLATADTALHQQQGFLYYKNQKFSGRTYELYANGDTALLYNYLHGKEEGWCCKWYNNKLLMEERFYIAGKKEGNHKGWWPDGKPKFDYHFTNDEHNGLATEWFSNGNMLSIFQYNKGYEEGLQKMWWPSGKVRANYVVKEGQQYGLIGRKLCINYDNKKLHQQ